MEDKSREQRKIYLTAYTYSGSSWLINCFIELCILVGADPDAYFHYQAPHDATHSIYNLSVGPESPARCTMPSLTFKNEMDFVVRDDVFIQCLWHDLPTYQAAENAKTIVLIRDPRDTAWAGYNSQTTHLAFNQRVEYLATTWRVYYEYCLRLPNMGFFKFEDYKKDPVNHLKKILKFCEIEASDEAILQAVSNSTYEKSKAAEQIYLQNVPPEKRHYEKVVNRSGQVSQWKNLSEHIESFTRIRELALPVMKIFSYE